ncbi:MAG: PIN domain-containing protein [Methanophagales archaeon]|nr:PIN domain-containing protein [Methanophagales archaeon]
MIVVDNSVFIDLIFEYNRERTEKADTFFGILEGNEIPILEPEVFRIELIGQLVRRMNKNVALTVAEEFFSEINFTGNSELYNAAFSIAFETGSRAIDAFYIAAAEIKNAILVSSDKIQVESARKFGVEAYYLLEEFDRVKEKIGRS